MVVTPTANRISWRRDDLARVAALRATPGNVLRRHPPGPAVKRDSRALRASYRRRLSAPARRDVFVNRAALIVSLYVLWPAWRFQPTGRFRNALPGPSCRRTRQGWLIDRHHLSDLPDANQWIKRTSAPLDRRATRCNSNRPGSAQRRFTCLTRTEGVRWASGLRSRNSRSEI